VARLIGQSADHGDDHCCFCAPRRRWAAPTSPDPQRTGGVKIACRPLALRRGDRPAHGHEFVRVTSTERARFSTSIRARLDPASGADAISWCGMRRQAPISAEDPSPEIDYNIFRGGSPCRGLATHTSRKAMSCGPTANSTPSACRALYSAADFRAFLRCRPAPVGSQGARAVPRMAARVANTHLKTPPPVIRGRCPVIRGGGGRPHGRSRKYQIWNQQTPSCGFALRPCGHLCVLARGPKRRPV